LARVEGEIATFPESFTIFHRSLWITDALSVADAVSTRIVDAIRVRESRSSASRPPPSQPEPSITTPQVLRQARLSRNKAAAIMVGDLVYEMASTGLRTPEIEEARQAAWIAISALAKALRKTGFAGPMFWKAALSATESWKELLT
jgi:hypothetical protein